MFLGQSQFPQLFVAVFPIDDLSLLIRPHFLIKRCKLGALRVIAQSLQTDARQQLFFAVWTAQHI